MPQIHNLLGKRFGLLVVVSQGERNSSGKVRWNCRCDCGNTRLVIGSLLMCGRVISCGCVKSTKQRLQQIWADMLSRCTNSTRPCYKYYGGRGITVCDSWLLYANFEQWAFTHGYADNLTIDRIDPDKSYYPANCRWLPKRYNQMRGFTRAWETRMVSEEDRRRIRELYPHVTVKILAKKFGCCQSTIRNILHEDSL